MRRMSLTHLDSRASFRAAIRSSSGVDKPFRLDELEEFASHCRQSSRLPAPAAQFVPSPPEPRTGLGGGPNVRRLRTRAGLR
jgi:hypothetical protein